MTDIHVLPFFDLFPIKSFSSKTWEYHIHRSDSQLCWWENIHGVKSDSKETPLMRYVLIHVYVLYDTPGLHV